MVLDEETWRNFKVSGSGLVLEKTDFCNRKKTDVYVVSCLFLYFVFTYIKDGGGCGEIGAKCLRSTRKLILMHEKEQATPNIL